MTEKNNGQFIGMLGVSWIGTVANFAAEAKSIFGALAALASLVASCYAVALARRKLRAGVHHRGTENTEFGKGGVVTRTEGRGKLEPQRAQSAQRGNWHSQMTQIDTDFLGKGQKGPKRRKGRTIVCTLVLLGALGLGEGCTFYRGKVARAQARVEKQVEKLAEESRALTTGIVDALELAPVSPATTLARDLAVVDQEIEGLPLERLPVKAALGGDTNAVGAIDERVKAIEGLRAENARLAAQLKEKESALLRMGAKYEEERNRKVTRWTKWSLGGLGLVGSLAALFVFCPVALPIAGRLLAWVVAKVPSMAGALGVVGKDAFDAVVRGVGAAREEMKKKGATGELGTLDARLREETDRSHKELIEQRRVAVGV